jgi:dipeptidyl aminopeptidase/acylaminoacyl peptidase
MAISHIPVVLALAGFLATFASPRAEVRQKRFTVRDSVEAAQFISINGSNPVLLSPDAKRYLAVIVKGDIARNGSWVELLSGSTASLDLASRISVVARLFSKSTAQADQLIRNVRWLKGGQQIAFLWDGGTRPPEVIALDLSTRKITTLAQRPTPIADYDVSGDGRTIVFTAQSGHSSQESLSLDQQGVAVTNQSLWALLAGHLDGWMPKRHFETFVLSGTSRVPSKVQEPHTTWVTPPELIHLSPDARFAIVMRPAATVPAAWDGYTDHVFKAVYLPAARQNPDAPNLIRQYFIIDIRNATARPLWDAPENPGASIVWSPDSKSVVIGPTFLPLPSQNAAGSAGLAVAEIDVNTGHYELVPVPTEAVNLPYRPVRWRRDRILALSQGDDSATELDFEKGRDAKWAQVARPLAVAVETPHIEIRVRQDLNTPPALYAKDLVTHTGKIIEDPNPELKKLSLAHVEVLHWKGTDGRLWTGTLYYPVSYDPGRRFPLVIQTHGYSPDRFLLDGPFTTAFAAQALANRDIAVLQVGAPDNGTADFVATPNEPKVYTAGYEGAIDTLIATGFVDGGRIGIIGFSRTGWYVDYMLTHSSTKLAAAEVADNFDGSYVQYILSDNAARSESERDVGSRPLADQLGPWIAASPGFNSAKIQAPLRMEIDTGPMSSILFDWEIFSELRYLKRPVELFVIPDIERGVHLLQNPAQRLASEGGTVDWFCFWLKDEQDPDPAKHLEYQRWLKLKAQVASSSGATNDE